MSKYSTVTRNLWLGLIKVLISDSRPLARDTCAFTKTIEKIRSLGQVHLQANYKSSSSPTSN